MYLITNQEHEAFDLKNSKREEERKGQREPGERREFPRCSLKTAKAGRRGRARGNWGEERVPPVFLWLAEMQIWGEMTFWGSVLVKKLLEK